MGLFDFFRKWSSKPDDKPEDAIASASADDDLEALKKAISTEFSTQRSRPLHYGFAHVALRKVARVDPLFFLSMMASDQRNDFLDHVIGKLREQLEPDERDFLFDAEALDIFCTRMADRPCVVVAMPEPIATTECYFTAAVLKTPVEELKKRSEKNANAKAQMDYYTLELGFDINGTRRTVLCSWDEPHQHHNFGTGPEPTVRAFLEAIENLGQ